jgi:thermitase
MAIIYLLVVILSITVSVNPIEIRNIAGSTSGDKMTTVDSGEMNSSSSEDTFSYLAAETEQSGLVRPNDPFFSKQWALDQIHIPIPNLWNITTGGREVLIAILDTGIDSDHEDLKGKVASEVNFTDSPSVNDLNGHGTHIAGIIAATTNNGLGVAGLVQTSKLMNVKVADDYGFCQAATVARGIIWAVDNGSKVINISIEIRNPSVDLEQAVKYAWDHGALIIAAAGNRGNEAAIYPAYYENSIAVAATQPDGTLAPLSNYGNWVDIAAPGFNIYSTLPDNKYGYETGTSFATAYVTGLAAIFFTIVNDKNGNGRLNDEVRSAIEGSFYRMDYTGFIYGK